MEYTQQDMKNNVNRPKSEIKVYLHCSVIPSNLHQSRQELAGVELSRVLELCRIKQFVRRYMKNN